MRGAAPGTNLLLVAPPQGRRTRAFQASPAAAGRPRGSCPTSTFCTGARC